MGIRVLSFNIHKGLSWFGRRVTIQMIRAAIRRVNADVIFLQEVVGHNTGFADKHARTWPTQAQFEFLADKMWPHFAYAQNAVYPGGHHGNAILSKYPIVWWENEDISTNPLENRGCLHALIERPGEKGEPAKSVHAVCVHLNLLQSGRRLQYSWLARRIQERVGKTEPLIVAGDFNDWRETARGIFEERLHMKEAMKVTSGQYARSFPARYPILKLDRIYVRNLEIVRARSYHSLFWRRLSDHAALAAELSWK